MQTLRVEDLLEYLSDNLLLYLGRGLDFAVLTSDFLDDVVDFSLLGLKEVVELDAIVHL